MNTFNKFKIITQKGCRWNNGDKVVEVDGIEDVEELIKNGKRVKAEINKTNLFNSLNG